MVLVQQIFSKVVLYGNITQSEFPFDLIKTMHIPWRQIINNVGWNIKLHRWKALKAMTRTFYLYFNVDRMCSRTSANEATRDDVFITPSINWGRGGDCSVPKRSHQTDIKKIHGCLCKKPIWLIKNDLASMLSLLSAPWTEIDSREALWKQELSNTWTWSLFAGPDSPCWSPSIQYLPQDVHKTQGITKLNTTTCSLPDTDRSSRASNTRHQKNQQALKRNKRKCRWQVFNKHIYCKGRRKTEFSQCASSSTRQFSPSNVHSACKHVNCHQSQGLAAGHLPAFYLTCEHTWNHSVCPRY